MATAFNSRILVQYLVVVNMKRLLVLKYLRMPDEQDVEERGRGAIHKDAVYIAGDIIEVNGNEAIALTTLWPDHFSEVNEATEG